jgi:hypothetical protein
VWRPHGDGGAFYLNKLARWARRAIRSHGVLPPLPDFDFFGRRRFFGNGRGGRLARAVSTRSQ